MKNSGKRFDPLFAIIYTIFLTLSSTADAKYINQDSAFQVAEKFISNKILDESSIRINPTKKAASPQKISGNLHSEIKLLEATDYSQQLHIFNIGENGFVIVSADDRTVPVLGYSFNGKFDPDKMPENVKHILDTYKKQIISITENKGTARQTYTDNDTLVPVEPLLHTKWGQEDPFNRSIPMDATANERPLAGCGPVSIAQVLNYHQWPVNGAGTYGYGSTPEGGFAFSADFGHTTYNWSDMLDEYSIMGDDAPEKISAVSTLMYHCGVSVEAGFGVNGTSSYSSNFTNAFKNYFRYKNSVKYLTHTSYSDQEWLEIIRREISAGRPVLYGGGDKDSRHSCVADGFDKNGYVHLNYGWWGYFDGYYLLSSLDSIVGNTAYNNAQTIIVGIEPDRSDTISLNFSKMTLEKANSGVPQQRGSTFTVCYQAIEGSGKAFSGQAGLALMKDNEILQMVDSSAAFIRPGSAFNGSADPGKIALVLHYHETNTLPNGEYQLRPAFKTNGSSTWRPAICYNPYALNYLSEIELKIIDSLQIAYTSSKTIHADEPGTVSSVLTPVDDHKLKRLVVDGLVEQKDLIRINMLKSLEYLDLKNATIVESDLGYIASNDMIAGEALIATRSVHCPKNTLYEGTFCNSSVKTIILPDSIDAIGKFCFYNSLITSIKLPDNITEIPDSAFMYCRISEIKLPENLLSIGTSAFQGCSSLPEIIIPSKIKEIKNNAFLYAHGLKDISIYSKTPPSLVTGFLSTATIHVLEGSYSLYNSNLWKISKVVGDLQGRVYKSILNKVPGMLKSQFSDEDFDQITTLVVTGNIDKSDVLFIRDKFKWLSSLDLEYAIINDGKLPEEAFFKDSNSLLKYIKIPSNTTVIGRFALKNCTQITRFCIPEYVIQIQAGAFSGCENLNSYILTGNNYSMKDSMLYTADLKRIIKCIPARKNAVLNLAGTVEVIEPYAFEGCRNLVVAEMKQGDRRYGSNGLLEIGEHAFQGVSNLGVLILPGTLRKIGKFAFGDCLNIFGIISEANNASFFESDSIFSDSYFSSIDDDWEPFVKVPSEAIDRYKSAKAWKGFPDISDSLITYEVFNPIAGKLQYNSPILKYTVNRLILSGYINSNDEYKVLKNSFSLTELDLSGISSSITRQITSIPGLKKVTLPENMSTIPNNFFSNNASLSEVICSESVISIGSSAFEQCRQLKKFRFPKSLRTIGDNAFSVCDSLQEISLPASLRSIGKYSFYLCSNIMRVIVPDSVSSIGDACFASCGNINYLQLPATLTTIGKSAFSNLTCLRKLRVDNPIPLDLSAVTKTFYGIDTFACILEVPTGSKARYKSANQWNSFRCIVDEEYAITDTVTTAAGQLASLLSSNNLLCLQNLFVHGEMDARDFACIRDSMPNLINLDLSDTKIQKYAGDKGTINGDYSYPPDVIPPHAFERECNLRRRDNLLLVNSLKYKTSLPFLRKILLPEGIIKIDTSAFSYNHLTSLSIPSTVKVIAKNAFSPMARTYLFSDLPPRLEVIEDSAFYGCQFEHLNLPNTLISIGDGAFDGGFMVDSLSIPAKLNHIGHNTLQIRKKIFVAPENTSFKVADGVLYDNQYSVLIKATFETSEIKTIPPTVKKIGYGACYNCDSLQYIYLPDSIREIQAGSFYSCNKLKTLALPKALSKIGNSSFYDCDHFSGSLTIPSAVDTIESWTFAYCDSLSEIQISNGVKVIDNFAFYNAGIRKLSIPSTISRIGLNAFLNNTDLSTVYLFAKSPLSIRVDSLAFGKESLSRCQLYVPKESISLYQVAKVWKDFFNINELKEFALSAGSVDLTFQGGSYPIDILSNTTWTVQPDQSWIYVSDSSGINNGTITLNASPNTTGTTREGKITFTPVDAPSTTFIIRQNPYFNTVTPPISDRLSIVPNPVDDGFVIHGINKKASLELYDMQGRLLLSRQVLENESVPLYSFKKGMYLLRVKVDGGVMALKLLKND